MYDMRMKTSPMASRSTSASPASMAVPVGSKRRSWTGRLKDRFRPSTSIGHHHHHHHQVDGDLIDNSADDWGWTGPHPQLHEGHHAPSVPSLQGSVFVAANFVYDYRQKYGRPEANYPTTNANSWMNGGSSGASGGHRQQPKSPTTFRSADAAEFRAQDVDHNIRLKLQRLQESRRLAAAAASRIAELQQTSSSESSSSEEEEDRHLQTTIAIDRPGLMVSGQRICILTGQQQQDPLVTVSGGTPLPISQERVRLKVEFQRNCALRRSLSDRVAPPMAVPASFHDTTRLTQKTRSRGSLHDLFDTEPSPPSTSRRISRPTEPPPPPPTGETPPVAPPRRLKRGGSRDASSSASPISSVPTTPTTPAAGRPLLTGQMVSWTAWSGQEPPATPSQEQEESKRNRAASRLWPSITSIGRSLIPSSPAPPPPVETEGPEEHIYEEIGDVRSQQQQQPLVVVEGGLFSRTSRAGSFAGASRQDILHYLEELRRKHPTGVISASEVTAQGRKSPSSPSPMSSLILHHPPPPAPPSPSSGDDDDEDDMGALLLAMRHNAPNRHSNRSSQSSTASTQGSQDSTTLIPPTTTTATAPPQGGGEIERNDSGVGSETSGTAQRLKRMRRLRQQQQQQQQEPKAATIEDVARIEGGETKSSDTVTAGSASVAVPWCVDCDQPIAAATDPDQPEPDGLVCHRCARRRSERREVLAELLETEVRYGRDLRVLQDELYKPLLVAGLVPLRQLDAVFLNVSELSGHSQRLGQRLREAVEIAMEQGDEDLLTVDVARLFMDKETEQMMDAFRRYCVRSGDASLLLSTLEKERELLRIFLRASQLENPALRRMDLHAFLMVPVQRITKYPLLLGRLLRATAQQDVEMREALREAQAKVESYLTAINSEAKELGSVSRPWRRGYSVPNLNLGLNGTSVSGSNIQRPSGEELMNLRLRKMAMDSLGWSDQSAHLVLEGQVKLTQPSDLLLTTTRGSRGRTLKWQNVWLALITLSNDNQDKATAIQSLEMPESDPIGRVLFGLKSGSIQEAAVVLLKDAKNPRPGPSLYREPLMLSQCTISCEAELPQFFEIHHIVSKESFIFQTTDAGQSQQWLHRLRSLSLSLGRWKQRRNALAHVMMIN